MRGAEVLRVSFLSLFLSVSLPAAAAMSAEQLTIAYGLLERTIPITDLKTYADEGVIAGDLRDYTRFFQPNEMERLRRVLKTEADFSPVAVAQFLYSEQGEVLLRRLGEVIRTESNLSGFYALRAAMIFAAGTPEGLTLMTALEQFPLKDVRVDLQKALRILGDLEALVRQTQGAIALIDQQSDLEARARPWVAFPSLPDLRSPGSLTWQKRSLTLTENDPDSPFRHRRTFPADVYLPVIPTESNASSLGVSSIPPALPNRVPLIVISHGLGSDRTTYAYLAEQLASYGFAVAVPEHPGSSSQQIQALISGVASEVAEPQEFVNRPLDVKFLLNTLALLDQSDPDFAGRIDLQNVGILGQSLGGYTALALAGAKINLPQLTQDCTNSESLNLSLLLQCRALELPQPLPELKDDRIKAVIAINMIGGSLLGKSDLSQVQLPVMIISGTADTVAPSLLEQILPFTWLQSSNKYLTLLQGGTHFSTIDVPNAPGTQEGTTIQLPSEIVGPDPKLAQMYLKAIATAFFKTYVSNEPEFQPYLGAAYVESISEGLLPIRLVRSLTAAQLAKVFRQQPVELEPPGFTPNTWSAQ
ncbi:MAG: alpha/beta hydrolase [Oculatellaceae cyanobacterium Prado106]|nr:alpha/beta hydrolase [Oculatellaceae cyanobacterium Prado106]